MTSPPILCPTRTMGVSESLTLGLFCSSSRRERPKSWTSSGLFVHFAQSASYPKLNVRTPSKSGSSGSHSLGQKDDASLLTHHVENDPPPRPWTNTRSATIGVKPDGSKSRLSPNLSICCGDLLVPDVEVLRDRKERLARRLLSPLAERARASLDLRCWTVVSVHSVTFLRCSGQLYEWT